MTEGPKIFDHSLLRTVSSAGGLADERYDSDGLVAALRVLHGPTRACPRCWCPCC